MINDIKKQFQMVFERVREPMLLVDAGGFIVDFNPAARSALHIGESNQIADVVSVEKAFVIDPPHLMSLLARSDSVFDVRLDDDEGNPADVVVDVIHLDRRPGKDELRLVHIKDYSSFRNYERWKDELISMVSHEIKNPLAAMKNSMSILISQATGPVNAEQNKLLTTSIRGIDRLTRLLDGFLDMSRIGAGKYTVEPQWINLQEFMPDVIDSFITLFNVQRQSLHLDVSDELEAVFIDGPKLEQILVNLLSNAVKFTPGGGEITVTVLPASLDAMPEALRVLPWREIADLRFVRISIKDTGIGMTGETISNVFTRYYATAKGGGLKGSHLGLSISKTLTEAQFGSLRIESEPGVGTEATVCLPQDETTTLVLSRLESIEHRLQRLVDSRATGTLALIRRADVAVPWARAASLFGDSVAVNPPADMETSVANALWTLGEDYGVVVSAETTKIDADAAARSVQEIGICKVPEDGTRVAQLLKQALYRLKQPSGATKV